MASKRSNNAFGDRAFRVVKKDTGHLEYYGPYNSLEGAQNKMSTIAAPYFELPKHLELWIEQTPGGWEKVAA